MTEMMTSLNLLDLPDDILTVIHKTVKNDMRKDFINRIHKMNMDDFKKQINTYLKSHNLPLKPYGTLGEYKQIMDLHRIPINTY